MKRKIFGILLFAALALTCLLILPIEAKAADASDLTVELYGDGKGYCVSSNSRSISGDLIIPATHEGKTITIIGREAFWHCTKLTSVTIPNSVTSIGREAFRDCTGLTSVTIPSSVTSIDSGAFSGCKNLTEIHITDMAAWCSIKVSDNPFPSGIKLYLNGALVTNLIIPEGVTSIRGYAFSGCKDFTSVTIPNSVTSIGSGAFRNCTGLTSLTIPSSVQSIGYWAFSGCTGLTSVTIPNGVTHINSDAFSGCTNLTSVTIPDSVKRIGQNAFGGCDKLTNVHITDVAAWCRISFFDLNSNILSNGAKLHLNGTVVTDLVIPEGVTNIRDYTFYGYTSLTSVSIPDSVTSIGQHAFYRCPGLTKIILSKNTETIGKYAFSQCTSLQKVYFRGSQKRFEVVAIEEGNAPLEGAEFIYDYTGGSLSTADSTHEGSVSMTAFIITVVAVALVVGVGSCTAMYFIFKKKMK